MLFDAKIDQLDTVLAIVESKLGEYDISAKSTVSFLIAVEEIFVNVANYAYPDGEGSVDIDLSVTDNEVRITFVDSGIAFDPLQKADPDVNATADERPIGGLGIYMVKKSMDGIIYKRENNQNILEFWKFY